MPNTHNQIKHETQNETIQAKHTAKDVSQIMQHDYNTTYNNQHTIMNAHTATHPDRHDETSRKEFLQPNALSNYPSYPIPNLSTALSPQPDHSHQSRPKTLPSHLFVTTPHEPGHIFASHEHHHFHKHHTSPFGTHPPSNPPPASPALTAPLRATRAPPSPSLACSLHRVPVLFVHSTRWQRR